MLLQNRIGCGLVHAASRKAILVHPPSICSQPIATSRTMTKQHEFRRSTIMKTAPASKAATMSDGWWKKDNPANMKDVTSIQQLVDELADAGDKLVIVEFYAPWCNACKALFPKLCQLVRERPDDVLLLKVSFEANKDMCKTMGVKVLPYFHLYRGAEGRVDAFSCTVSKIQKMKDAIENYAAAFCSIAPAPGVAEFPDVHAHPDAAATGPHDQPTRLDEIGAY